MSAYGPERTPYATRGEAASRDDASILFAFGKGPC
jgi:hypothetical protein